jgi:protein-disulfide isomerase
MASRAEQKAAARAAREAKQKELSAAAARRMRLLWLGGLLGVVIVALVVVIVVSSSGGGSKSPHVSKSAQAAAIASVNSTLAGIPQSGNVLGDPKAKITLTEYGDLVCPTCAAFADETEPGIIKALVKTGQAKLEYRAFETASGTANRGQFINTQVAVRAAGLQGKAWNYILLTYAEQPQDVGGTPAEEVSYVTTNYLQSRAQQIKGLNLAKWQANMTNKTLINQVKADESAALHSAAATFGTPALFVSGPRGSVLDRETIPTLAKVQALISQVS